MPFKEIKFKNIIFDPKVQKFCVTDNFKCPNYKHSWACPPEAPYMEKKVSKYSEYYLIYTKFNLSSYVKNKKEKNPDLTEEHIRNRFYMKNLLRDDLEVEIISFLDNFNANYDEKLILWDGHCRLCRKRGYKECNYDQGEPCRFPNEIRYSMEAVGIHVTDMVKRLDLDIEWPPINYCYRFALVCFR